MDNAAIALLEGDLNETEVKEFETYLDNHPEKKKQAAAFQKTILTANESIVFENKKKAVQKNTGQNYSALDKPCGSCFNSGPGYF